MSILSIGNQFDKILDASHIYGKPKNYAQMIEEEKLYRLCAQQYLGFGWFLQFVPYTHAHQAKNSLGFQLSRASYELTGKILSQENMFGILRTSAEYERIMQRIPIVNIFEFMAECLDELDYAGWRFNKKNSLNDLLNELYKSFAKKIIIGEVDGMIVWRNHSNRRLIFTILNPIRYIDTFLHFLHLTLNALFEIGASKYTISSWPRIIAKSVFGTALFLVHIPLKIGKFIIDELIGSIVNPLINLFEHMGNSIKQTYNLRDQEILFANIDELRQLRRLRKAVKERLSNDSDFVSSYAKLKEALPKVKRRYIGVEKADVYADRISSSPDFHQIVAISSSESKIRATVALHKVVQKYNINDRFTIADGMQPSEKAISEAVTVLRTRVGM